MKLLLLALATVPTAASAAANLPCHARLAAGGGITTTLDYRVQEYGADHVEGLIVQAVPAVLTVSGPDLHGSEHVVLTTSSQNTDRGSLDPRVDTRSYNLIYSPPDRQFAVDLDDVHIAIHDGDTFIRRTAYALQLTIDGVAMPVQRFDPSYLPGFCAN